MVVNRSIQFEKIIETDCESTNTVKIDPALLTKDPDCNQSFGNNSILIVSINNNGISSETQIDKNEDSKILCGNNNAADISFQTGEG